MVGPGEVDEELEPETAEECTKYGKVNKCVIYEVGIVSYYLASGCNPFRYDGKRKKNLNLSLNFATLPT